MTTLLKKFLVSAVTVVVSIVVVITIQVIIQYDGSFLKYNHKYKELKTPVDVSSFMISDIAGEKRTLAEFKGKPTLVMFWATWCKYCKQDMPKVAQFKADHPKLKAHLLPIAVATDDASSVVRFFSDVEPRILNPYINDTNAILKQLNIPGVPAYVLINAEGFAVATLRPNWGSGDVERLIVGH